MNIKVPSLLIGLVSALALGASEAPAQDYALGVSWCAL